MKFALQLLLLLIIVFPAHTQTLTNGQTWHYQLTDGAAFMDDCPTCDRLSVWEPLKGRFDLIGTATPNLFRLTNIFFSSGLSGFPSTEIRGRGTLSFAGGEPDLTLDVTIIRAGVNEAVNMTNAVPELPRIFPIVGVEADESPGSLFRVYRLRIPAAPLQDIWFSTSTNVGTISHGSIVSRGLPFITNQELTELLSIPDGDVGLDAMDIGPRGEIFFSTTTNVESAVSGPISHGDIVTSGGRIYLQSAQLLSEFGVDDPEAGLDALHIVSDDEVYFSISKDIPRPGAATLHRGDILSNKGRIVRTEAALLARWVSPITAPIGVDAIFVWPNGEIWFSTENAFANSVGIRIGHGDLISDQGYIVYRNADLLSGFPSDPAIDYGLDALSVISDANASAAPTQIIEINVNPNETNLRWESEARVFQVERAASVSGPYVPMSNLTVKRSAVDLFPRAATFYRVRQW